MIDRFTGKSTRIIITMPEDLHAYLKQRKAQDGVPIAAQVRMALERDIFERAEHKLVDSKVPYVVEHSRV